MKQDLENQLAKNELVELLSLSQNCLRCNDRGTLKDLVVTLGKLIYFEFANCAYADMLRSLSGANPEIDVLNISYPEDYLDLYVKNNLHLTDPVMLELVKKHQPVHWKDVDKIYGTDNSAANLAFEFNMNDGWAHGVVYPDDLDCSYFFFGGPHAENGLRTRTILEYIIPFYAEAYKRVLKRDYALEYKLTAREKEVLNWIKEGKSSWDISMILHCSKRVVEFHVGNIKKKLNAVNRAQAVAIGLQYGIVSF
jgi:DNA-binding CsgD family transcriptional regulator